MRRDYFKKKKWTKEQEDWLLEHKEIRGRTAMYNAFCSAFPDATFTEAAISTKRTELGAYGNHPKDRRRNAVPLYSERIKKGYVIIKVSKCEWWPKNRWVWVATHPGEPFDIHNQFLFLDGDNFNFKPENIIKVDHRILGILNREYGGCIKGEAELNSLRIKLIEHKLAILDAGEKLGLVKDYGSGRAFIAEKARKQYEYVQKRKQDPEYLTRQKQKRHEKWLQDKENMTAEQKEKRRKASREWMHRRYQRVKHGAND